MTESYWHCNGPKCRRTVTVHLKPGEAEPEYVFCSDKCTHRWTALRQRENGSELKVAEEE